MRFVRQCAIFRGPLDAAPVVGVLFLLVIFMLLDSRLYTPGVLLHFAGTAPESQTITVTSDGHVIFAGKTNAPADLNQLRAEDLKNTPDHQPFYLQVEPGADPKLVAQVRDLFQVQLPDGDNLTGVDNPTVIVAVNFRGEYFYENRAMQEPELKAELRRSLQEATKASKKLTMVLWADKSADNEVVMRVCRLARDVGITECLLAEKPSVFAAPSRRSRP